MQPQGQQDRWSQFREAIRARIEQWREGRDGRDGGPANLKPKVAPGQAPKAGAPDRDAQIKVINDRLNELNRKLDALLKQSQPGQPGQPGQPPVRPNVDRPQGPQAQPPADGDRPRGFGRFGPGPGLGGRFGGDGEPRSARPDSAAPAAPPAPRDGGRDGDSARPAGRPAPDQSPVGKIQDLVKAYQDAAKDATPQERRQLGRKLLNDIRDLESQQ